MSPSFRPVADLTGCEEAIGDAQKKHVAGEKRRIAPVELWKRKKLNNLNDRVCNLHSISNGYLRVSVLLSSAFLQELDTVDNFATVNEIKVSK